MEILMFLVGAAVGILSQSRLMRSLPRARTTDTPPRHRGPFPSLTDQDLRAAVKRTYRDERFAEMQGFHYAAETSRTNRRRYEGELARRAGGTA